MSYRCDKCGKKTQVGCTVSHSNRHVKRKFKPNLQKKKLFNSETGLMELVKICTRCLRTHFKRMSEKA